MNHKTAVKWYTAAGIIAVLFGIFYALFGLQGLPAYRILVPSYNFTAWSNGLYGAVFIGFGVLLFFVGRQAFRKNDKSLMRALLYGINSWLIVEALFSLYYGVYFNVGVDIVLSAVLSIPLIRGIARRK